MVDDSAQPDISNTTLPPWRLRLRNDLLITPRPDGESTTVLIEDPVRARFFQLGRDEYVFLSMLDGSRSLPQVHNELIRTTPNLRLTADDMLALSRWSMAVNLASPVEANPDRSTTANRSRPATPARRGGRSPLVFRVPLGNPDRFFAWLTPWLSWTFSVPALVVWNVLMLWGGYRVLSDWNRFAAEASRVFTAHNWIWLAVCWTCLKVLHECAHALACKRQGGQVSQIGLLFVLFAPLAYVDVTSSWRFRSPGKRLQVTLAGVAAELLVAGLAALTWSLTPDTWLGQLCHNMVITASISTLLLNANPLMRFDGYYALSDVLRIPNLYTDGQTYVRYWFRRYLFGLPTVLPVWVGWQRFAIPLYGWASAAWRIVVVVGLTVAAARMFHGAGIVLAGISLGLWIGTGAAKLARLLLLDRTVEARHRLRFASLLTCGLIATSTALVWLPWPGQVTAPAIVDFAEESVIRAASPGRVLDVHVRSGQNVLAGDVVLQLENRKLQNELLDLELQVQQSELKERQFRLQSELAAMQAERERREGLLAQLAERKLQVSRLTLRAPQSGQILGRHLDTLVGTYVAEGDRIMSVVQQQSKQLNVSIDQDDVDAFQRAVGQEVRITMPRRTVWYGRLEKLIPRATRSLDYPALAASEGGTLPVQPAAESETPNRARALELVQPRFSATVSVPAPVGLRLRAGERAAVTHRPWNRSIGQHLQEAVRDWLRRKAAS